MAKLQKNFFGHDNAKEWTVKRVNGAALYRYSVLWKAEGASGTAYYRTEEMARMFIEEMEGKPESEIIKAVEKSEELRTYCVRDREAGNIIDRFDTAYDAEQAIKKYEREDGEEADFYEIGRLASCVGDYSTYTESPIKRMRQNAMMTQKQLADASGSSIRTIQDWESGRRIPRDVYVLRDVAKALNCNIEDLIE